VDAVLARTRGGTSRRGQSTGVGRLRRGRFARRERGGHRPRSLPRNKRRACPPRSHSLRKIRCSSRYRLNT
jgi:hypothetical protein